MKRPVIYISDSTGITAETLGHSLLTQFSDLEYETFTLRFINTVEKATQAAEVIQRFSQENGVRPIVFSTLVEDSLQQIIIKCDCLFIDFMQTFIQPLEQELATPAHREVGHSHGMTEMKAYQERMSAVNYALQCDDGIGVQHYDKADVIMLGVSRSGKTPSCVYLAMHFGIFAANYPLVEGDIERLVLPESLKKYREKLFGLTITPERLHQIRSERRPNSEYASLHQCQYELRQVEALYRQFGIDYLNVTRMSVEEIATSIMIRADLKQHA
ncbi:MAG: kinase/pyrophosphorylase [Gammaproteobacteria bacterium]|nr:kinase/pyrophosphorylase [Gammaproteobacteria bacterium]